MSVVTLGLLWYRVTKTDNDKDHQGMVLYLPRKQAHNWGIWKRGVGEYTVL